MDEKIARPPDSEGALEECVRCGTRRPAWCPPPGLTLAEELRAWQARPSCPVCAAELAALTPEQLRADDARVADARASKVRAIGAARDDDDRRKLKAGVVGAYAWEQARVAIDKQDPREAVNTTLEAARSFTENPEERDAIEGTGWAKAIAARAQANRDAERVEQERGLDEPADRVDRMLAREAEEDARAAHAREGRWKESVETRDAKYAGEVERLHRMRGLSPRAIALRLHIAPGRVRRILDRKK